MPKYRDYFRNMMAENEKLFADFHEIHTKYSQDKQQWQEEYNRIGAEVVEIARDWERKLCGYAEKGQYAKFSSTLSEKFWAEIKAFFPLIDFVGVKVVKAPTKEAPKNQQVATKPARTTDPDLKEIEDFEPDDFVLKKLF